MSVAMAIFSCAVGSDALLRHWEYFKRQEADRYHVILTEDARCRAPAGVHTIVIGADKYLDGPHLPNRMLNTIERMLMDPWRTLILVEYDTLWLKPIPVEKVMTVAGHFGGGKTWGSKANCFVHMPHVFARDCAIRFLMAGRLAIKDGMVPDRLPHGASVPEASPDVFLAAVCEANAIPMQFDLWGQYSRNSLDVAGHLEEARQAYRDGVSILHGLKSDAELKFILS